MFERLKSIVTSRTFEIAITFIIILNAITLGLETWPAAQAKFGDFFHVVDTTILVIFVVEIAVRLLIHRHIFFWRSMVYL